MSLGRQFERHSSMSDRSWVLCSRVNRGIVEYDRSPQTRSKARVRCVQQAVVTAPQALAFGIAVRRTLALLLLALAATVLAHPTAPSGAPSSSSALDPGLGPLHHKVSTRNGQAQAYF